MKNKSKPLIRWIFVFLILLIAPGANPFHVLAAQPAAASPDNGDYAPGVVLVGYQTGPPSEALQAAAPLAVLRTARVHVPVGQELVALARLRHDPDVAFAELDYAVRVESGDLSHSAGIGPDAAGFNAWTGQYGRSPLLGAALSPNDPSFPVQFALNQIEAPEAWELTTGSPDVVIAIVDSGIQIDHPDLASKIWTNLGEIPDNDMDDDGNGKVDDIHGWRFYHTLVNGQLEAREDSRVDDEFGHGTHVSGIAAAATDNGVGIAGVSWGARLMAVRVLDEFGYGWYSDIAAGIIYAADNGARIINLSLGGSQESETLKLAVDYALQKGSLVVAASGNQGDLGVAYPAAYEPVLAVAAVTGFDTRPSFSNYGPQVDLAAPGVEIYSTWNYSNYFIKSGTSMAAPHVSGAAALLLSLKPSLAPVDISSALTVAAEDVQAPGYDIYTGWGRLDVAQAAYAILNPADLWIAADGPIEAWTGETVTVTLRYGNHGPGLATGIWIRAVLPAETQALSATEWQVGPLLPDGGPYTQTMAVRLEAPPGASLVYQAQIGSTGVEEQLENNRSTGRIISLGRWHFPFVSWMAKR